MEIEGLKAARLATDGTIKDVRADHVGRYRWAAERLSGHVVDAGCNCGYGSAILADAGLTVTAMDCWPDGLAYAREHWDRPGIAWVEANFERTFDLPQADAVVAFEVVEHLGRPAALLRRARERADRLLASVPNEDVWPWAIRLAPVHKRHYRRGEFEALLRDCGWADIDWFGQEGGYSQVESLVNGRTLVADCR